MRSILSGVIWLFGLSCLLAVQPPRARAGGLQDEYVLESETGSEQTPVRIPEGIAFDPVLGDFYATAIFGGRITRVSGRRGVETTFFVGDPGISFAGIKIAPIRRVAWVCGIDQAAGSAQPVSYLYAIAVPSHGPGRLLQRFDLPTPFFCNDLALDHRGDVYVTNSLGSAIMKVEARSLWDGSPGPRVFASGTLLEPPPQPEVGFATGMNGIAVTPDDKFVLVVRASPVQVLRISRTDPTQIEPVVLAGDGFGLLPNPAGGPPQQLGPDGIVFVRDKLYVVFNSMVQQLTFAPGSDFSRASVATRTDVPFGITTAANAYGELYVVDAEIHALLIALGLPVQPPPIELPHRIVHVDIAGP